MSAAEPHVSDHSRLCSFFLLICISFFVPGIAAQEPGVAFNWQAFEKVLKDHIRLENHFGIRTNVVNYEALLGDQDFLNISRQLYVYDPSRLNRQQTLAFYINAYNYYAINIVLTHWPVDSIRDIGSFFSPVWGMAAGSINQQEVTLDQIEHEILRKFDEPRIHFAIVCSSNSCPDLRREIYTAVMLDSQLDDQVRSFLANQTKGVILVGNELYVSKIFDWFEEDFDDAGGVIAFISRYDNRYSNLEHFDTLDYDWRLNDYSGNGR